MKLEVFFCLSVKNEVVLNFDGAVDAMVVPFSIVYTLQQGVCMNVRQMIFASVGLPALSGCISGKMPYSSVQGCDPATADLNLQSDVTVDNVNYVLENWSMESISDIDCDRLCTGMIYQLDGWETSIESCDVTLDSAAYEQAMSDTGMDASTVVGNIDCQGSKFEYYCEGRRPLGFQEQKTLYFANAAQLEAASVIAFVQLAKQLKGWGAPESFIERCMVAAQDEVRHAQALASVAQRKGQRIPPLVITDADQDMVTVAVHNACEGCVFETWSALEAVLKSQRADPSLREMYATIAEDEMKHAQLSWELHAWLLQQLSPEQITVVEQARSAALLRLREQIPLRIAAMPVELGLSTLDGHDEIIDRFVKQVLAA